MDVPSKNLQIHNCTITEVYPSGLVDARSDRGGLFSEINTIFFGAEGTHKLRDRVVVLTDGAHHYILGQVKDPTIDPSGNSTVRNLENDLADLVDSKSIVAGNDSGTQAKIVVSPGGGVIIDSGEGATSHYDPGHGKITNFSERSETVTVPFMADHYHDGVLAHSKYKWRTTADMLSMDRDLSMSRDDSLDMGPIASLEIGPAPDVLLFEYKMPGIPGNAMKFEVSSSGAVTIDSGVGLKTTLNLSMEGLGVSTSSGGKFEIDLLGRVWLGNEVVNLINLVDQTLMQLQAAMTITIFGPSPLINAPVFGVIQGLLASIKPT